MDLHLSMDKQPLLTAMRLTRCRLMPYIVNTLLCWRHFSGIVPAVLGGSVGHGCTYLDLHRVQWHSVFQNVSKLSQIIENTSIATATVSLNFCNYPVTLFVLTLCPVSGHM